MNASPKAGNGRLPPPRPQADWAYFLDLDGTLVELAATPEAVPTDAALQDLIATLHQVTGGAVALVSGRTLADLDSRFGRRGLPVAGQHGLERRDAAGRLRGPPADPEQNQAVSHQLAQAAARHPGLLLEDKGLTLALHYRACPRLGAYVQRLATRLASDSGGQLLVQRGKYVAEIKPAGFDKGSAIGEFLAEPPFCGRRPVFIGDDLTDELGFAVVNRLGGISVKVGRGRSQAAYRLPDVAAVRAWLGEIACRAAD